jgi:DNA-binding SARP family transcriptional activator
MLRILGPTAHAGRGLFPRRGYEIVAVAALSPFHTASRSALATLLWGELSAERAFGNLRYVVAAIRRWESQNGILVISADSREIKALGHSDLDRLLSFSVRGEASASALRDYFAGELLSGHEGVSQEFESWLAEHRARVDNMLIELALICSGSVTDIDAVLELALARSPFDERLIKAKVANLLEQHRVFDAREAVSAFSRRFRDELGTDLGEETRGWLRLMLPEPALAQPATRYGEAIAVRGNTLPKVVVLHPRQVEMPANDQVVARAVVTEITIALCRLRTFAMFAPHTARQIESEDGAVQASLLGADYLVNTQILSGSRLAFSLLHLASHKILFADTVNLSTAETAAADMGQAVANSVAQQIASTETYEYRATGAASAYMHYLLGCERLRYDLPAIRKARKHFVRALDLFPYFAPAKSMLARTLNMEWLVLARPEPDLLTEALAIAKDASTIDPLAPSGHWEIGHSLLYLQRIDESYEHIERARNRAPHLADLLSDEADVLVHLGEGEEAQKRIGLALALNPLAPDEYHWVQGSAEFISGDYRGALRSLGRMADRTPVARLMAASAAMIGEIDLAREYREIWLDRYPNFRVADWVKIIPVKKPEVVERTIEAMRRAGFE